jgi:hypothetical protein
MKMRGWGSDFMLCIIYVTAEGEWHEQLSANGPLFPGKQCH